VNLLEQAFDYVLATIVMAVIGSATNSVLLVVLYLTLKQAKSQNTMNKLYHDIQLLREKHSLTFAFSDWVATEIKYYSPLYEKNKSVDYILSTEKINKHLISVAEKLIILCNDDTVDKTLMRDEIDRLRLTLEEMNIDCIEVESALKILLD